MHIVYTLLFYTMEGEGGGGGGGGGGNWGGGEGLGVLGGWSMHMHCVSTQFPQGVARTPSTTPGLDLYKELPG